MEDGNLAGVIRRCAGEGGMTDQAGGDGFRWTVRVRFGETDPYGVVYFVSYFRYIKEALD
jgi:hypothetical protein